MFKLAKFLFKTQRPPKYTTGLVGVPVQLRWRPMLLKLIDDVFSSLTKHIPENTFYRVSTENNFKFFQKVIADENNDYEDVEDIINRGQVEELIMMFEGKYCF
jgi:NADH dehydrogenase (ubiquinone) 1 alpha subcomplex subunit 5